MTAKKIEKNIEDIKKNLKEQEKLARERLEKIKYLQADFENYKKQFEKEKKSIIKLANESLISDLIVFLDDLENSIKIDKKEGLILLKKKIINILSKYGLKEIKAIGKKFNPELHEVILKEKNGKEEITEEIQKGYELNSKVIRPSKVKISTNKNE